MPDNPKLSSDVQQHRFSLQDLKKTQLSTPEPFIQTTQNNPLAARQTNIPDIELGSDFTPSATANFTLHNDFSDDLTPDYKMHHHLCCAPDADTATVSRSANRRWNVCTWTNTQRQTTL